MDTQQHSFRAVRVTLDSNDPAALRTSGKPPLDFVAEKGMAIHTSRCLIALRDVPSNTLRFSGYARGSGLTDAA